jgi:MraZ protein
VGHKAKSDLQYRGGEDVPAVSSPEQNFLGVFQHSIDEKGRISFPVEFRNALSGDRLVLTNYVSDGARCLEGFQFAAWEEFTESLKRRSRFEPKLRQLENFYLSRAHLCALDTSGRIIIPQHLRHYAGLERDVVFSSSLRGFRLWDKRVWDLVLKETEAALIEDPSIFEGLDLEKRSE